MKRILLLIGSCTVLGATLLSMPQQSASSKQYSSVPTPAPLPFLYLPFDEFDTNYPVDWRLNMSSVFDHHYPDYDWHERSEDCLSFGRSPQIIPWFGTQFWRANGEKVFRDPRMTDMMDTTGKCPTVPPFLPLPQAKW
jgi:hypothetical protein